MKTKEQKRIESAHRGVGAFLRALGRAIRAGELGAERQIELPVAVRVERRASAAEVAKARVEKGWEEPPPPPPFYGQVAEALRKAGYAADPALRAESLEATFRATTVPPMTVRGCRMR